MKYFFSRRTPGLSPGERACLPQTGAHRWRLLFCPFHSACLLPVDSPSLGLALMGPNERDLCAGREAAAKTESSRNVVSLTSTSKVKEPCWGQDQLELGVTVLLLCCMWAGGKEDEMVGWHHRRNGHEFEQAPGDGDG